MMTNPHVVAELRCLFRQGSTPSRLIGHIVASHPAEPNLPALVNAYFRDAFHIPFVRLAEMPTGNGTTELLYAHLNADLVHEMIRHRSEWDRDWKSNADGDSRWLNSLPATDVVELNNRAQPAALPELADCWEQLNPRAQNYIRRLIGNANWLDEKVRILSNLAEGLQQQVAKLQERRGKGPTVTNPASVRADSTFLKSTLYEQLVEHVFVSEVLQEAWYASGKTVEVLRSEVDASGYDVVFECNGILRHVQLKTSKPDAKADKQSVNIALAEKPSGCVVWILRQEDTTTHRMSLSYLFFGDEAGKPLPSLHDYKTGRHTKGAKNERPAIRLVPKRDFVRIPTTQELVLKLFGLRPDSTNVVAKALNSAVEAVDHHK